MRSCVVCVVLLSVGLVIEAPAQALSMGVSVGASSFSGSTTAGEEEPLRFAPYRPTMWGIVVSYGRENRIFASARYGEPGLGFRGVALEGNEASPGLLVIAENAYHLGVFTGGLSIRLARLRGGPALRPSLALVLERWSAPDSPTRTLLGGQAGLAVEIAISKALTASLEGELGFTPGSPFREEDLPEGFRPRSTWRRTLAGAVYFRF